MKQNPTISPSPPAAAVGEPRRSIFEQIGLLARSAATQPAFFAAAFQAIAREHSSPYATWHIRRASEIIDDHCHTGTTNPAFWKGSLSQFLTESLGSDGMSAKLLQSKSGQKRIAFVAAPVVDAAGASIGAFAMVIGPLDRTSLTERLATIEAAVQLTSQLVGFIGPKAQSGSPARQEPTTSSGKGGAFPAHQEYTSAEELAYTITNELRTTLTADMVAAGLVQDSRVHILSISGLDEVRKQSPGVVVLRAAMEECLDAKEVIVCQREEGWTEKPISSGHRLHKQWHASAKGDAVTSIPLKVGSRIAAILSIRRRPDKPFKAKTLDEICKNVEPFVPTLVLARNASRGLFRHGLDSLRHAIHNLLTAGHWSMKAGVATAALFLLWFFFGKINYDLTVPATLRAANPIHIAAPFDGTIASVRAIEGDAVKKGDVLCELDTSDLRLQRAELVAQISVLDRERDKATSQNRPVEAQLALANRELAEARLALVDRKIERSQLRAPMDGMVVAGDLRTRLGALVPVGEPLVTVAPAGLWSLELSVSESAADDVTPQLSGAFATLARPELVHNFKIARVLPAAHTHNQDNIYIAEADLKADVRWMRPGMEGVARVHLGARPVWWAALHRAIDYVRLNLWV